MEYAKRSENSNYSGDDNLDDTLGDEGNSKGKHTHREKKRVMDMVCMI